MSREAKESSPIRDDPDPELQELLAAAIGRVEEEGESAIDAVCVEHPGHADWLRDQLERLHKFGMLPSPDERTFDDREFPDSLGEFRLLKRLGGGGMGVVYLAEQGAPRRNVALKVVRPDQMYFPKARERFRREIETIARLEHPGIVRIYAVGEERGIPYFAMEWIDGVSVDAVLRELRSARPEELTGTDLLTAVRRCAGPVTSASDALPPAVPAATSTASWSTTCLRIVRQIAEALHHAHERGILHRDVKPANVMLTATGRVVLLDFGLAMSIAGSGQQTRITQSGSQLGSLPYMAPEQLRSERDAVSVRTDVYSLGVLLYELLTHRLPFEARDVQSLRAQILAGQVEPPHRRNTRIEWDVETICLKAMDPDPVRRYATALAFARDLDNVLEQRPIEARRATAWVRLRRQVRLHPARAVALLLAGLLLTVVPTIFASFSRRDAERERGAGRRIQSALDVATEEGARATREQRLAEKSLTHAMAAIEQMLTRVAVRLENEPRTEELRRELLKDAVDLLERLRRDYSQRVDLLSATAGAWLKVARLQQSLGDYDAALVALKAADEALDAAQAAAPARVALREQRLELAAGLAEELLERGRLGEVDQLLNDARSILQEQESGVPASVVDRFGSVLARASFAWSRSGDHERAQAAAKEAVDRLEALPPRDRERAHRAEAWFALGDARLHAGELEGAREALSEARALFEERLASGAPRIPALHNLVMAHGDLGQILRELGDLDAATQVLEEGITYAKELVAAEPSALALRAALASLQGESGRVLAELGRLEDAERELRASVEEIGALAAAHPDQRTLQRDHASRVLQLGDFLYANQRAEESLPLYEEAERVRGQLVQQFPDDVDQEAELAVDQYQLAIALAALHRDDEALEKFESAFERLCRVMARASSEEMSSRLRRLTENYAGLLEKQGRAEDAAAVRRRAKELLALRE